MDYEAMRIGRKLESKIRRRSAKVLTEVLGRKISLLNAPKSFLTNPDIPRAHANIDGWVEDERHGNCVLEIKTTSPQNLQYWEKGVPDQYTLQVQHYLAITESTHGFILLGVYDPADPYAVDSLAYHVFEIQRDEEIIACIKVAIATFWEFIEFSDPPNPEYLNEVLAALLSSDKNIGTIENNSQEMHAALSDLLSLRGKKKRVIADERAAVQRVLSQLDLIHLKKMEAVARCTLISQNLQASLIRVNAKRIDTARLKKEQEELVKKYTYNSTNYQIRTIKEEGYV